MNPSLALAALILKIIGVIVCTNKAKFLNRNAIGWGFGGFFFPIPSMIIIYMLPARKSWRN